MKIVVVGTGYVGLVNGVIWAEMGNQVICSDVSVKQINKLKKLEMPIYEKGLEELVRKNVAAGRLNFTTNLDYAVDFADIVFTCVGTPPNSDGSADLSAVFDVANQIGRRIVEKSLDYRLIVNKSTIPPGTTDAVAKALSIFVKKEKFDVAMNPEFLQEGKAVENALRPDRIVIGVSSSRAEKLLQDMYLPFRKNGHPIYVTTPIEAELVKYTANTMLATRLGLINEIANFCDAVGANVRNVLNSATADARIGRQFAHPSGGYGGSCFPKDVKALVNIAKKYGVDLSIASAVDSSNELQKKVLVHKIHTVFSDGIYDKKFAMWGLAFKAGTDDARESPAITIATMLLCNNSSFVQAYDPEAMNFVKEKTSLSKWQRFSFAENEYSALKGADALVICTEWPQFKMPDFDLIKASLKSPIIFDNKNLYDPVEMDKRGFAYFGVGVENNVARSVYRKLGK